MVSFLRKLCAVALLDVFVVRVGRTIFKRFDLRRRH